MARNIYRRTAKARAKQRQEHATVVLNPPLGAYDPYEFKDEIPPKQPPFSMIRAKRLRTNSTGVTTSTDNETNTTATMPAVLGSLQQPLSKTPPPYVPPKRQPAPPLAQPLPVYPYWQPALSLPLPTMWQHDLSLALSSQPPPPPPLACQPEIPLALPPIQPEFTVSLSMPMEPNQSQLEPELLPEVEPQIEPELLHSLYPELQPDLLQAPNMELPLIMDPDLFDEPLPLLYDLPLALDSDMQPALPLLPPPLPPALPLAQPPTQPPPAQPPAQPSAEPLAQPPPAQSPANTEVPDVDLEDLLKIYSVKIPVDNGSNDAANLICELYEDLVKGNLDEVFFNLFE